MFKLPTFAALACCLLVASTWADNTGQDAEKPESRLTNAATKASELVKQASTKQSDVVVKSADNLVVKVEKLVNPEPHQPGQTNVVRSAVRGVGRLGANVTVEASRAINSAVGAGVRFLKKTVKAAGGTLRQAGHRVMHGRAPQVAQARGENHQVIVIPIQTIDPKNQPDELHRNENYQ